MRRCVDVRAVKATAAAKSADSMTDGRFRRQSMGVLAGIGKLMEHRGLHIGAELANLDLDNPFLEALGATLTEWRAGYAEFTMPIQAGI